MKEKSLMRNSIRWLLTESKISSLDPQKVNYVNGKLICYHLTSHQKWANYNPSVKDKMENPLIKHPKQEVNPDDARAVRILKSLKNSNRVSARDSYDIEEETIMDMIDDPYTDTSGFNPGGGDHHGKGLYTCYKFNPGIARTYGDICLVFEIDISNFVITFEDLAKQVHGKDWRIKDQLLKLYKRNPRDEQSLEKFLKILDRVGLDKLELNQTINEMRPHSSQFSYTLMKAFSKEFIASIYDGIVFLGRGDGPVCVSYYPKYDSRLIGLGRLSKRTAKADVDWYDSLNDFLGGRARNKLDFQTMNAIAEENTSLEEKEQMKEDERTFYDAKHNYVLSSLENIRYSEETIQNLVEFYEEVKSINIEDALSVFYREVGTGKFTQSYKEFNSLDQKVLQEYGKILEETYQFYKNRNNIDEVFEMLKNTGYILKLMSNISFSNDFLINGVYDVFKTSFKEMNKFEYHERAAADFLKSASSYIRNANASEEFVQLIQELDDKYGIDIKLKTSNWIELIDLYENSNQKTKDRIINLPEDIIVRHPFKAMTLPDSSGNFIPVHYYKSKEIIDKFCSIVDIMIKKRNINVLDGLELAFVRVEHPLSDIVVEKCVDELLALPESENKNRLTGYLADYFDKFSSSNASVTDKFDAVLDLVMQSAEKEFNKLISNLEKKTKTQAGLLSYHSIYHDASRKRYFESQQKEWHERFVNLIIENVKSNHKFTKLKEETCKVINYSVNLKDIRISDQDMSLILIAAGNKAFWFVDYKYMSQSVYCSFLTSAFQNKTNNILYSCQLSVNFFKNLYGNKQLLDAFIQYSDNGFFKRTLERLIALLKGQTCPLGLNAHNLDSAHEITNIDMSQVINSNDSEWFNYLLEEIRTKTNSGKTKKAAKLFKELDTLMAQRNVSQESGDPELDLSHREIFGNSLKEAYSF